MSTELINRPREGYQLTGFYGGDARGYCLQITGDHGYVQVTREGAARLAADIFRYFLEVPGAGDVGEVDTGDGPPPLPRINVKCETVGSAFLKVIRVEREDNGSLTAVIDHWPRLDELAAQQPAEGEEIMVDAPYDVFILPLRPSGLSSGPRFVVHVPQIEAHPAEDRGTKDGGGYVAG